MGKTIKKITTKAKFVVNRDCYNSYFYKVEDNDINVHDMFKLYSSEYIDNLDGGSALHLNLEDHLTKNQYGSLLKYAAQQGCNYWCVNVLSTICNSCEFISKDCTTSCSDCGSDDIDHATRVIGYLKRIPSFAKDRQTEADIRHYKRH